MSNADPYLASEVTPSFFARLGCAFNAHTAISSVRMPIVWRPGWPALWHVNAAIMQVAERCASKKAPIMQFRVLHDMAPCHDNGRNSGFACRCFSMAAIRRLEQLDHVFVVPSSPPIFVQQCMDVQL